MTCTSFFGYLNFCGHIQISKVILIKIVHGLTPVRPSCAKLSEVKVLFDFVLLINIVRMVVQTCHVACWNQFVKLHLTMGSEGHRSNLEKYAYFGRYGAKKKKVVNILIYDRTLCAL